MPTPNGITAALIARNNSDVIGRCLESLKGAVEAIVVVDTGSTDATMAIAESYGARIRQIEWTNHFADARNVSLDMVSTRWTLWIDSDEWFLPIEAEKLRDASRSDAAAIELLRRNHMPNGELGIQAMIRLWRTHELLRMRGRIHERIESHLWELAWPGRKVFRSNISFEHDGFGKVDASKPMRNLPLLLEELEDEPDNLYMLAELYATYLSLGMLDKAREVLKTGESLILKLDPNDRQPGFSSVHLIKALLIDGVDVDAYAAAWYGDAPEVVLLLAQRAIQSGDLLRAFEYLMELEDSRASNQWNAYIPFDRRKAELTLATNLSIVAHQLGYSATARIQYLRLLELDPGNPVATQNMALL